MLLQTAEVVELLWNFLSAWLIATETKLIEKIRSSHDGEYERYWFMWDLMACSLVATRTQIKLKPPTSSSYSSSSPPSCRRRHVPLKPLYKSTKIYGVTYQYERYWFMWDLTLRWLMSYIYGAPILDVSRSHTTTQHSR